MKKAIAGVLIFFFSLHQTAWANEINLQQYRSYPLVKNVNAQVKQESLAEVRIDHEFRPKTSLEWLADTTALFPADEEKLNTVVEAVPAVQEPDLSAVTLTLGTGNGHTKSRSLPIHLETGSMDTQGWRMTYAVNSLSDAAFKPWVDFKNDWNLTLPNYQGNNYVNIKIQDAEGNEKFLWDKIIYDSTKPAGSVLVNAGDSHTKTRAVNVTIDVSDNFTAVGDLKVRYAVNSTAESAYSGWVSYESPLSVPLPNWQGKNYVNIQIEDKAGNRTWLYDSIIYDRTSPAGSITLGSGSGYTNSRDLPVHLAITDNLSPAGKLQVSYAVNSTAESAFSGWESFESPFDVPLPGYHGTNYVNIRVRDEAGNVKWFYDSIVYDSTAPSGAISVEGGKEFTNSRDISVEINVSDDQSAAENLEVSYAINSTEESDFIVLNDFESPLALTLPGWEGPNYINIRVRDQAGNTRWFYDSIVYDQTQPAVAMLINGGADQTNDREVNIHLEASDTQSSNLWMSYAVNSIDEDSFSDWVPYLEDWKLTLPNWNGINYVNVRVKDEAENERWAVQTIILDTTPFIVEDQIVATNEGVRKTIILGDLLDSDSNPVSYNYVSSPLLEQNGVFQLIENQLHYMPDPGFTGSGQIEVVATHGAGTSQSTVDFEVKAARVVTPNDPLLDFQYGLYWADSIRAWNLSRGKGVTVAVIDTGIEMSHPDLNDNIFVNAGESGELADNGVDDDNNGFIDDVNGWDFYDGDNNPADGDGHGTHVAGIVAAENNNGSGVSGIAPEADLMPLKVTNDDGKGILDLAFQSVANAINYAVDLGARVINMSLGRLTSEISPAVVTALQNAVDSARAAGAVLITSAGNKASDAGFFTPVSLAGVIGVAATTVFDTIASFSNFGNEVDVSAPGVGIYSTVLGSSYEPKNGTSMASPFVAGLAAMILSQDSTANDEDVLRRLQYSSVDLGETGWDPYFGYGRIDAFKALSYDYYDDGTIKTQWLEEPDENGYTRLDFDVDGRMIGGMSPATAGFSGIGTWLAEALPLGL